jgi:tripartite-type tricarboxylate transporter receptor subunit TctC
MKLTRRTVLAASATMLAIPAAKASLGWPTKGTIRLIATFPPGGAADTISRILAPKLSAVLGAQVVVENKPGAGGTIGSDLAAKSPADGYTLVISHASPLGIAPGIYPKLPYDVVRDFTHVSLIGHTPNVLIVPAGSPYKTLADYIADAKAKPDQVAFGSSGIGSNTHLMGEQLSALAGVKLKHVPYRGSAPSLQDMLAGAIPSMFDPITTNVPHINAPARCACWRSARTSDRHVSRRPDLRGAGFPDDDLDLGRHPAPRGLARGREPASCRAAQGLQGPDVIERFKGSRAAARGQPMTPAEYAKFVGDFLAATWTRVSKRGLISLEARLRPTRSASSRS